MHSAGLGHGCTFFFEIPVMVHAPMIRAHSTDLFELDEAEELDEAPVPSVLQEATPLANDHRGIAIAAADDHVGIGRDLSASVDCDIPADPVPPSPPTSLAPIQLPPLSNVKGVSTSSPAIPDSILPNPGAVVLTVLLADDAALTRKIVERMVTTSATFTWSRRDRTLASYSSASISGKCLTPFAANGHNKEEQAVLSSSLGAPLARRLIASRTQHILAASTTSDCIHAPFQKQCGKEWKVTAGVDPLSSSLDTMCVDSTPSPMSNRIVVTCEHAANGQIALDKVQQSMLPWRKPFHVVLIDCAGRAFGHPRHARSWL